MEAFRLNLSKCYLKIGGEGVVSNLNVYCVGRRCSRYPTCLRERIESIVELRGITEPNFTTQDALALRRALILQEGEELKRRAP